MAAAVLTALEATGITNWLFDEYTHEPGKTRYGDIVEAIDSGDGTQLELPMSVGSLKELGMIHEA